MSKPERLDKVMLDRVLISETKPNGKNINSNTESQSKKHIEDFFGFIKDDYGITREPQIEKKGLTAVELAQSYVDILQHDGMSASEISTRLVPICKGLNIGMNVLSLPPKPVSIPKKHTKEPIPLTSLSHEEKLALFRIINMAKIFGMMPDVLCLLDESCLKCNTYGEWYVEVEDKNGNLHRRMIFDHELELVQYALTHRADGYPLNKGEHPFSKTDFKNLPYDQLKISRAQEVVSYFEQRFSGWKRIPSRTFEQREKRKRERIKADNLRNSWIEILVRQYHQDHPLLSPEEIQSFKEELSNPSRIYLRGKNRKEAMNNKRPISYDRVAVAIVASQVLSIWGIQNTVRHLNKPKMSLLLPETFVPVIKRKRKCKVTSIV